MRMISALAVFLFLGCADTNVETSARSPREVVKQLFEAFNRHDAAAMRELYAPEAVHESPAFCEARRGPEQIADIYRELFADIPDVHDEITRLIVEGNQAAVTFEARGKTVAGVPVTLSIAAFFEIRDGTIVKEVTYYDVPSAPVC